MMSDISQRDEVEDFKNKVKQLREKNDKLRRAVDELSTLNELALDIGGSIDSEEDAVTLNPGEKLVIFSDGIIDSRDEQDERFGEEKLQSLLMKEKAKSGNELMNQIFNTSLKHNANPEPFDDMTMVLLSRKP